MATLTVEEDEIDFSSILFSKFSFRLLLNDSILIIISLQGSTRDYVRSLGCD